jgi:hypothetical protein
LDPQVNVKLKLKFLPVYVVVSDILARGFIEGLGCDVIFLNFGLGDILICNKGYMIINLPIW